MAYEIDFIGTDKAEKDYDAIAFRYYRPEEKRWIKCVYDGGTTDAGEALLKHLEDYYFNDSPELDYVFCSHPDSDHASGLRTVLENVKVRYLVMNIPWLLTDILYERINDGRITIDSLEQRLREKYKFIDYLEKSALKQGRIIIPGIVGAPIAPEMKILSPTFDFYFQCLVNSEKTTELETLIYGFFKQIPKTHCPSLKKALWGIDAIREGEETSMENESSIILKVTPECDSPFLLVGDAGCKGLSMAMDLADSQGQPLNECTFLQIPHHGGRHNVSPPLLDRLIGKKVSPNCLTGRTAFVSVGKNSDHPRKSVINAFINRGCKVFVSRETTIHHFTNGTPKRDWAPAKEEHFSEQVEEWDD